jgi:hypothetical protein
MIKEEEEFPEDKKTARPRANLMWETPREPNQLSARPGGLVWAILTSFTASRNDAYHLFISCIFAAFLPLLYIWQLLFTLIYD